MNAEIAVGRVHQLLEIAEAERIVDRERADDSEPQPLVNQTIELLGFLRRGERLSAAPFIGLCARASSRAAPFLATVSPGDWNSKCDVKPAECRAHYPVAPATGANSAMTPAAMKHRPITGTIFTENAPPATTAVPYRSSQTPGIASTRPARYSTSVSSAPTTIGGEKLSTNFRAGPRQAAASSRARALRTIAHSMMIGEQNRGREPDVERADCASSAATQATATMIGEHADRDHSPAGNRGEGPGGFHRIADESEIVHRAHVERRRLRRRVAV